MSSFRILHLVRPFLSILPEVKRPDRKVWACSPPITQTLCATAGSLYAMRSD